MAKFNKSFLDFSSGEISPNSLHRVVSEELNKGVSYLENAFTNSDKSLERRTGTLKVTKTKYPVDPSNPSVRLLPLFIGRGVSFIGMMYVVDTTGWDNQMKDDLYADSGILYPTDGDKILVIDWYKSSGSGDTYSNTLVIYLDTNTSIPSISLYAGVYPKTASNEWVDLYGFNFAYFQNMCVATHSTGCVEPFVFFYRQGTTSGMSWFNHRDGLNVTNPDYWPNSDISRAISVPFDKANANPNTALKLEKLGDTDIKVTAQWYDKSTSSYGDWSTTNNLEDPVPKPHPLRNRIDYLRVTILANSYILRYMGSEVSPGVYDLVDDLTLYDSHKFSLHIDADGSDGLWTVISNPVTTSDFNLESFNITSGYPDNCIFFDQRLVFIRDGVFYNSNVGNAFLFNQYRFPQAKVMGAEIYTPLIGSTELRYLPLLIDYSGQKVASDAFDFTPLTDSMVDNSWVNKSQNLEFGTYTEVNNISGLEDSMYSYNSIKSLLGTNNGSKRSVSIKAGSDTIFIDGNNRSARNYYYDGRTRRYHSDNLFDINPDIVKHLMPDSVNEEDVFIKEVSYNVDSSTIYFVIGPHNALIGCTYSRDSNVLSLHRVTLGGESRVEVYSSAFVRNDKSLSVNYIATQRDGEFWLERFAYKYNKEEMNAFEVFGGSVQPHYLPCYLDFASRFVGSISGTFNIGMDYAGKSVEAFGDGFWIGTLPVDSLGNITLDRNVRTLVVGYKYGTDIIFLECEPNVGGTLGEMLHALKSYEYVHLRLNKSFGGKIANISVNELEKIPYENDDMIVGQSLKLFTGSVDVHLNQRSSVNNKVRIFTDAPYPFEIVGVLFKGEVNER